MQLKTAIVMMGRANGTPFTLMLNGRMHLVLWPNTQSAFHYKTRNPELLIFSPALVATPSGQKNLAALQKEDIGLFLLPDTGSFHFSDGRKVSWKEVNNLLPVSSLVSTSATRESVCGR